MFLKRNIKVHNTDLKSIAYSTLVRPQLQYASTVWSPHTATDIAKLEAVQRSSAHDPRHNHLVAHWQIPILNDFYKCTFFPRTIADWTALPFHIPILPTVAQFSHAVCKVVHILP